MELPEKLELLEDNPTWIAPTNVLGFGFDVPAHPELAAEIANRYNAYLDHQSLIKHLVEACTRARMRLLELGQKESVMTIQILNNALTAAEKIP